MERFVNGLPGGCDVGRGRYCLRATIQRPVDSVGKRSNPVGDLQLVGYPCCSGSPAICKSARTRAHEQATRDVLTGLQNRRAFLEAGIYEVERSKRYAYHLAVVFLDLDDFKQLNDTKGHDAGDAVLQATAKALLGALRSSDRVARLGGDEFSALLPEIEYAEAVEAGRKISIAVNNALREFPPVTVSIGIAWFGKVDRSFQAMLKAADELLYEVKESGKNNMLSQSFDGMSKPHPENQELQ